MEIHSKKGNNTSQYSKQECKHFIQFKKRKGDPAMPLLIEELWSRAKAWQQQPSLDPSLYLTDNEEENSESKLWAAENKNASGEFGETDFSKMEDV